MTRFDKHKFKRKLSDRPWQIHPIWRGIGCILFLLFPVIAYSASHILIQMNEKNNWVNIPFDLSKTIRIPIPSYDLAVPYLYAKIVLTIVILLFASGLLMIIYTLLYQIFGPSRYGPLDAKPNRKRPKRK